VNDPDYRTLLAWTEDLATRAPELLQFGEADAGLRFFANRVQPVLVRPVKDDAEADFELCFGHRRHRACLDLALPLRAVIEEVSDQALFEMMARENLFRKDLTPYETGTFYRRALKHGLYPHQLALSKALNVSPAMVSRALAVADLPEEVVGAFPSPLQIQYRWGLELVEALKTHSEDVLEAATRLRAERGKHGARAVHHALLRRPASKAIPVKAGGRTAATIMMRDDAVTIAFGKGRVPASKVQDLRKLIAEFLSQRDVRLVRLGEFLALLRNAGS